MCKTGWAARSTALWSIVADAISGWLWLAFLRVTRSQYLTISTTYTMQKNSKLADDAKLKEALNMLKNKASIQRDLKWVEEKVNRNLMKFNKNNAKSCTWAK